MVRRAVKRREMKTGIELVPVQGAREVLTLRVNRIETNLKGAFVRILTDATDTDEQIAQAAQRAKDAGAERVIVLPKPKGETLPEKMQASKEERHAASNARETAHALVQESSFHDKALLHNAVTSLLDRAGV